MRSDTQRTHRLLAHDILNHERVSAVELAIGPNHRGNYGSRCIYPYFPGVSDRRPHIELPDSSQVQHSISSWKQNYSKVGPRDSSSSQPFSRRFFWGWKLQPFLKMGLISLSRAKRRKISGVLGPMQRRLFEALRVT